MKKAKLLRKVLNNPRNVAFAEMMTLLEALGFHLSRVKGSHHIYAHPDLTELVNIQNVKGQVKAYQVRQILRLIEQYDLELGDD